ncbi:MAG: hypothetical protein KA732_19935 [Providencia sp.]|uniref:hypothetical protein n=1 Tax=Providencia sp. TaxID=589 RepID=UPI001B6FDF34|nr:hypothetical protein [Providencia sp.]MBP6083529.1 hypothetical protein [Providencia sp.]
MSWKPIVSGFVLSVYLSVFIFTGIYFLADNTCGTDKTSLEKRCQKAIDYHKGKQVNYEIR